MIIFNRKKKKNLDAADNEAAMRQALSHVEEVFWIMTIEQDEVIFVSPSYEEVWQRPCSELVENPMSWKDSIHKQDIAAFDQIKSESWPNEHQTIYRIVRPDNSIRWIKDRAFPIHNDKGEIYRVAGVAQDITESRNLELKLLEAKESAELANQTKSLFLSQMSHELRTPLNAILGFGQLLSSDSSLDELQQDNAKEIISGGKHLLSLINDILDLSKIDTHQLQVYRNPCDLVRLIKDCLKMVSYQAEKANIYVKPLAHNGEIIINLDSTRVKQILINLLSNAIKYNKTGGHVAVKFKSDSHKNLYIGVLDTGVGLTENQLEQVFEPFNRLDIDNPNIEGCGIGLTITRQLAQLMGGDIEIESTPGTGSTFWLRLPLSNYEHIAIEESEILNNDQDITSQSDVMRVLYVEDNPANIKLMEMIFRNQAGFDLDCAITPEIGLELLDKNNYNLVLLDINLPRMDGYAVLDAIRQQHKHIGTPVLAVSSHTSSEEISSALAAGFGDFVTKPIDINLFLKKVEMQLH